jgi:hypothetical protein
LKSLVGKDVNKADGEHSTPRRVTFDDAFHPVLVVGAFIQHNENFTFLELQLVVIVGVAVVEGAASL